uniref:GENERAL CONTROL PROTEIN GCN4, NOR1 BINDING PROTEIN, ALPHA/BETA COILED.6A n=1 Tax=Siphoviridae sp. ctJjf17 TaxID=2827839 RepID=A0A8S5SA55_9CAUD|nr:MAG TPA: GENERAL CONTROL PROTEIN GCN4, NOR1 BINDING PROTEIN, ALPHA/BETA COILED.6A [Siphoviridae sp. ctJjf17]
MIDKKIQLTFNSTVNKRIKVRSNCELYSHDKNNNEFELTINNHTLTNEEIIILFKFVKSIKYWETQGTIEDNKIKFKFDTSLITDNERVNCYIILKNEEKESDVYSFSFDVKMSEYDLKDNLPIKERYFANGVVVDKLDVLTKEVLATELEKAKNTFALKSDLSEFVRTSDISDVVRTVTLNDYQLKSEMPNVVEIVNNTVDSKGFLTTHQSLIDYAKKSELPIDYVSNAKLEELKTQLTIDTSNFATKQELQAISGSQLNVDNLVTKDELNSKGYLTQHQDISNLATKQELQEVSNRQPVVDTSNLATKEELQALRGSQPNVDNLVTKDELNSKGYLTQHQSLEEYAKKTELPQPYNDTDIKSRLTVLENKPSESGNVDTSNFATKQELRSESLRIGQLEFNEKSTITKFEAPFKTTGITRVEDYLNTTRENTQNENYGRLYTDNYNNHLVVTGSRKTAKFETLLYTVGSSLPDAYEPDFEFSEGDNIKFITSRNIHDYLPRNTGNTGNTTELDNRLKVIEAKQWEIHGRGMPNGTVTAPVGTTYVDEAVTNGALKWIKKSGTGNVGWEVLIGDTGWRTLPAVSKLGNSFVKVRRKNDTIFYQFGGLSWGWFGVVRRGGAGYQLQGSDRERNCYILGLNGVPQGFRSESSLIGGIYNDKGTPYGTWYLGGAGDSHMLRFQFTDPVPTDRDIGDIRVSSISYLTNDPWPQN